MHDPYRAERGYTIHPPVDNLQTLDAARFRLAWNVTVVEALGPSKQTAFRMAIAGLTGYLQAEHSNTRRLDFAYGSPAAIEARAEASRHFMALFALPGSTVSYDNRNTRYTNIDGVIGGEPLDPRFPSEVIGAEVVAKIPNPLNHQLSAGTQAAFDNKRNI
jgi:hypothetical protein